VYKPLHPDRLAFRLLRLQRGDPTAHIVCYLFESWLLDPDARIPYDALSYTWGSNALTAEIIVNGSTMHITQNLNSALSNLRGEDDDRVLWIDSICINQLDNKERSYQVNMMKRIYSQAEQVIIWLGKETTDTNIAMDCMMSLQKGIIETTGDWRHSFELWMLNQAEDPNIRSGGRQTEISNGIKNLLKRTWFRRIWVLQEVANAQRAVVHCGDKSVSARIFAQMPSLLGIVPDDHCRAVLDIMPGFSRKESWWDEKRDLQTLLYKFRQSHASDQRDKIYALLGMSTDACDPSIFRAD
jgi:Heterokaryon incompatibility protein (HET)